ncbi:FtsX-like permease family protein [Kitasatospora azatica]|uniref:FtsX-like permease family protein n=1 Tax=Kitasatospora azatica TaxID=58347 RepID=UPI0005617C56|nr:FtsX-like permease family protein [Kitasatospora azatica]
MGGFVLRRLRSRLALAGAAALTIVLTAAVLAALNAFDAGVGDAGVRRALLVQDRSRATVQVTTDTDLAGRPKADKQVHGLARDIFDSLPSTVRMVARSHAYALPVTGAKTADGKPADPDLTLLATIDPAKVALTGGRLPQPATAGAPVEVAAPDVAISRLGLNPSALPLALRLVDRLDGSAKDVLVTGTYHPADGTDPYWQLDPLGGHGLQVSGFATYGPLLTPDTAFSSGAVAQQGINWLVTGDFGAAKAADMDALRTRIPERIAAFQNTTGNSATSQLPDALGDLHNDLLVAESTLVIGALQLAVLAIAALVLVTRLLSERQTTENALLTARGAAWYRVAGVTALEAGVLALPAALLAPLLTPVLLGLLGRFGPLADTGVRLDGGLDLSSWLITVGVAIGAVLIVLIPTVARTGGAVLQRRAGRRQALAFGLARSGADLALLALAVLAYLQLSHYGSGQGGSAGGGALSADAGGQLGLDPVLVTAPTLALCAGTVLALRLLPLAARLGERRATRGRGLPAALAGWQFARRPRRNAGPVLLMVLAVSMGMLALGQAASLSASQRDQADFTSAHGLRVSNVGLPALGQAGVLTSLPGGDRFLPVSRQELPLRGGSFGQLLAVDSKRAADGVTMRPDLTGGQNLARLLGQLADPTSPSTTLQNTTAQNTTVQSTATAQSTDGIVLPGAPIQLSLDLSVRTTFDPELQPPSQLDPRYGGPRLGDGPGDPPDAHAPRLRLDLHDRFGLTFSVEVINLPDQGDRTVTADMSALFAAPAGRPAYPLTLTGIEVSYDETPAGNVHQQLTVHRIGSVDSPGAAVQPATHSADLKWQAKTTAAADRAKNAESPDAVLDPAAGQDLLTMHYFTGRGSQTNLARVAFPGPGGAVPSTIDAIATQDFLTATGTTVGAELPIQLGTNNLTFKIIGVVPALPTAGSPGGGPSAAVLADLATIDRVIAATGDNPLAPTEWWLPSRGRGDQVPATMATALKNSIFPAQIRLDRQLVTDFREDPLGAAPQSGLLALTIAAAVLAAIGFAAAAVGAAGERAAEFAVLRALGTPQRQLARTAAAEQGILIALGLGVGTLLGIALVHLVVPLTVLTPAAHRPVPSVQVVLPLWQVLILLPAVAALPALLTVHRVLRPARAAETVARLRHSEEM